MKYILSLFLIQFSLFSFSQNVKLKTGDILFQSMNCGPLCEAINEVTEGYQGKDFSHLGLVYIKNDSIFIIEAAGKAVKITPYETFKTYNLPDTTPTAEDQLITEQNLSNLLHYIKQLKPHYQEVIQLRYFQDTR
jgi:hypothetical protein